MHDHHSHGHTETIDLPTSIEGLEEARRPDIVELSDGDEFELEIEPVKKQIGDATVRMLAYGGSVPGPTLKVAQHSTITVRVANRGDMDATVHWHGLRLENRYDGTHETQAPIPVGDKFSYELTFPDPGLYWYHPHIREDYGQEMGLYGNILVVPGETDYWPPAHRDVVLTLDDVLVEEGRIAPFSSSETTHVAMGRFGNVMLVAGHDELELEAKRGEIVRLHLTNTANTRVFNVMVPGARMKLVGADSGHYEHEEYVEEVLLAPSERIVVDVHFAESGELALEHRTPEKSYRLAAITIADDPAEPDLTQQFENLRTHPDMQAERERIGAVLDAPPDKTVSFVAEMDEVGGEGVETGVCACPMDEDVVATWAGKCPKCGMKLMPAPAETAAPTAFVCPMHPEITATWAAACPKCGMTLRSTGTGQAAQLGDADTDASAHREHHMHGDGHGDAHGHHEDEHSHHKQHEHGGHAHDQHKHGGHAHDQHKHGGHAHGTAQSIEWEDDMVEINRMTTPANMRWKLVDGDTGAENARIDWTFRVGDQVKLRLVNEMDSDHPMPHPFHVHGAGRFLILARDGVVEPNLVWKDTVLVRTGETVDILLDVTNPGRWMAHCHIAEHHESGMMFSFDVLPESA
jgi:FtsP/CotA-like multicopper oxidase with cupredoxin domain